MIALQNYRPERQGMIEHCLLLDYVSLYHIDTVWWNMRIYKSNTSKKIKSGFQNEWSILLVTVIRQTYKVLYSKPYYSMVQYTSS